MGFGQPRGGRGRRCAEDDLQAMAVREGDGAVEPGEVEPAVFRLEESPGELGHVDEGEAERGDVGQVAVPFGLRPVLGVVIDPDLHELFLGEKAAPRSLRAVTRTPADSGRSSAWARIRTAARRR